MVGDSRANEALAMGATESAIKTFLQKPTMKRSDPAENFSKVCVRE